MPLILLSDNGSTRVNATLQLRELTAELSKKTGHKIYPVSLQHADQIAETELNGIPARTFTNFITQKLIQGERHFVLLPLFFGNSKAITRFIPAEIKLLKEQFGDFKLDVCDVIYPMPNGEKLLSKIILEHIHITANSKTLLLKNIVLVDHGSPSPRVTEVRKHLTKTVQNELPADCTLEQAVMERREGKEYDFNGDLLKDWLTAKARSSESSAIVVLMFFLPGRHAGNGGDIAEICASVTDNYPKFKISISPLITNHPDFLDILQNRLSKVLKKK